MQLNARAAFAAAAVTAALSLSACGSSSSSNDSAKVSFDATNLLATASDTVITTTYANLKNADTALKAAIDTLATTPSATNVTAARNAWKESRSHWESSEGFLFGPVDTGKHDPAMDDWPLDFSAVNTIIDGSDTLNAAFFAAADTNRKGFHGIEYMLWNRPVTQGGEESASDAATRLAASVRSLDYAQGTAADLLSHASTLSDAWDGTAGDYANTLKTAGAAGNTVYVSQRAAVQELIEGLSGIADEVGSGKMGTPLAAGDDLEAESRFSGNSYTDFANNISSIRNIYLGSLSGSEMPNGLKSFVDAHDNTLGTRLSDEINAAIAATEALTETFSAHVVSEAAQIQAAIDLVLTIRTTLDGDVTALLDKTTFTQ